MKREEIEGNKDNIVYLDEYRKMVEEREAEEKRGIQDTKREQENYFLMDDLTALSKADARRLTDSVMALIESLANMDVADEEGPCEEGMPARPREDKPRAILRFTGSSEGIKTTFIKLPVHPLVSFFAESDKDIKDNSKSNSNSKNSSNNSSSNKSNTTEEEDSEE